MVPKGQKLHPGGSKKWSKMRFFGFLPKLMICIGSLYGSYCRQNYFGIFGEKMVPNGLILRPRGVLFSASAEPEPDKIVVYLKSYR